MLAGSPSKVCTATDEAPPPSTTVSAAQLSSYLTYCRTCSSGKSASSVSSGSSHFDVHHQATDRMLEALATQADFSYGEGVNMLDHALQAVSQQLFSAVTLQALSRVNVGMRTSLLGRLIDTLMVQA